MWVLRQDPQVLPRLPRRQEVVYLLVVNLEVGDQNQEGCGRFIRVDKVEYVVDATGDETGVGVVTKDRVGLTGTCLAVGEAGLEDWRGGVGWGEGEGGKLYS